MMRVFTIISLAWFTVILIYSPSNKSKPDTVENVGSNLIKYSDNRNRVNCYYVSGFPEGLSCVKL